jgi:protein TonB
MLSQAPLLPLPASTRASARPGIHRGARLALGGSLLLHGVAVAWVLSEAPSPPQPQAPRVQVALIEAPRPSVRPESPPAPAEAEPAPAPPVAVEAPAAPARPEPVAEKKPRLKQPVVERAPAPKPVEPAPEVSPEISPEPAVTKAEPAPPAVVAPDYEADYLNNPPPAYPRLSRRLREEGEVELRVRVSPQGQPMTVELARSSGSQRLDEAALRAVRQWRFEPARQGSRAVEAWVRVPIHFKLEA